MPEHLEITHERYQLGDVVTLKDRIDPMTVEAIRDSPFGITLSCCWFDGQDCLNYSDFSAKSLNRFPRLIKEPEITLGTELRLRSRGPVMTVMYIEDLPEGRFATCEWTGPNDKPRQRMFPVNGLVLSMFDELGALPTMSQVSRL